MAPSQPRSYPRKTMTSTFLLAAFAAVAMLPAASANDTAGASFQCYNSEGQGGHASVGVNSSGGELAGPGSPKVDLLGATGDGHDDVRGAQAEAQSLHNGLVRYVLAGGSCSRYDCTPEQTQWPGHPCFQRDPRMDYWEAHVLFVQVCMNASLRTDNECPREPTGPGR